MGTRFPVVHYRHFRKEAQGAFDELFVPSPCGEDAVLILALAEEPYRLLAGVEAFGSLNKAARFLKKCYCWAWKIISRFEKTEAVADTVRTVNNTNRETLIAFLRFLSNGGG